MKMIYDKITYNNKRNNSMKTICQEPKSEYKRFY